MAKFFNDTGNCIPARHYMVDTSGKIKKIITLIEQGKYFTFNRPRQYGKTTTISALANKLKENSEYFVIRLSFEGIGDSIFESNLHFCERFVHYIKEEVEFLDTDYAKHFQFVHEENTGFDYLSKVITNFVSSIPKKVVIIIDEVDKSSDNQLFLHFIGLLRDKYLKQNEGRDHTFYSVILAGVHDVKTLKLKISPESTGKLNSPWNIASDFTIDMSFNAQEISTMLIDYCKDKNMEMDIAAISERIYYYTSGYPYLVSKMCKVVDEIILQEKQIQNQWTVDDMELCFKKISAENYTTTLFDDLTKNLENNPELYQTVFDVIINSERLSFNINDPVINLGFIFGIFTDKEPNLSIHNRIFEQRIYNYLLSKYNRTNIRKHEQISVFHSENGLVVSAILRKFQQFMRENNSDKDKAFLEREGRLLFLSFIKPIINGSGFDFKEPTVGNERRMDLVITYLSERYVIELKRWEGEVYHKKGLQQLSDYLDIYSLKKGYLLIYDFRKEKEYREETIQFGDKEIFAVWV